MTRKEKWVAFYESAPWDRFPDLAPAFVQRLGNGLWCIQYLAPGHKPSFSWLYRLFKDPPYETIYEPYYNGWPGDHRGWMKFATAEEARDFYRFANRFISFDEYRAMARDDPHFDHVRIDLDHQGNFASGIETAPAAETEGLGPQDGSPAPEGGDTQP